MGNLVQTIRHNLLYWVRQPQGCPFLFNKILSYIKKIIKKCDKCGYEGPIGFDGVCASCCRKFDEKPIIHLCHKCGENEIYEGNLCDGCSKKFKEIQKLRQESGYYNNMGIFGSLDASADLLANGDFDKELIKLKEDKKKDIPDQGQEKIKTNTQLEKIEDMNKYKSHMDNKVKIIMEVSWIIILIIGGLWVVGSWMYDAFNPKYIPPPPPTFHGSECITADCGGHKAGFEWAQENGIDNIGDCNGNSESFEEGCRIFVQENH